MPKEKMNPDQWDLKKELAKTNMNALMEQFMKNPGPEQFARLEKAMYDYQQIKINTIVDDLIPWKEEKK